MATGVNVKCVFYRGAQLLKEKVMYSSLLQTVSQTQCATVAFITDPLQSVSPLPVSAGTDRHFCSLQRKEHETVMFRAIVLTHCHHS